MSDAASGTHHLFMMGPKPTTVASSIASSGKKRKEPPRLSSSGQSTRGHDEKRSKIWDARTILTQRADAALNNGELDLQAFLKSREFEITALQSGIEKSKGNLTSRAFQQVPRDLRRRTASHNVKKVPRRLQNRARREMREDNTPTVLPNKRKPGSTRSRLRAETAKRLGILAEKKRAQKAKAGDSSIEIRAARPKIRKNMLNDPPKPRSKFRKRQMHKTWLPTHMWLAKRARMTEPKDPLWRFALPITSTEKSYRPTHRAGGAKGAVAWDMSYMSTMGLEGPATNLEEVLRGIGVMEVGIWDQRGHKWRQGKRTWCGWLSKKSNDVYSPIAPCTILWCPSEEASPVMQTDKPTKPPRRRLFIRIHPSAFLEAWTEVLRLSKIQRPAVQVEDLRFEIGSIDITGPGSTETLLGILHPYTQEKDLVEKHAGTFKSLVGVTNPASLPPDSLLSFSMIDPRLRYPPRSVKFPSSSTENENFQLLEMLATWSVDTSTGSTALFSRDARFKATRLPSQKALNRRKSLAAPGEYATITSADPAIPITLYTSRGSRSAASQGTWTLLAPWKCILPIWYGLVHYPLSSGGNPRFGGIEELRQIHFEQAVPWFPADYPGTAAGMVWETDQRVVRKAEWERRPRGKRVEWDSLDLGAGRKGELGNGWACDFEKLLGITSVPLAENSLLSTGDTPKTAEGKRDTTESTMSQLLPKDFNSILSSPDTAVSPSAISTIRLTLVSRGVATSCARIYRLPPSASAAQVSSSSTLQTFKPALPTREQWLSLLPPPSASKSKPPPNLKKAKDLQNIIGKRIPLDVPLPQRIQLLAKSLTQNPPLPYPPENNADEHLLVPGEEDLIGFVTTGAFNLAEGKGVAIGAVSVAKVLESLHSSSGDNDGKGNAKKGEGRLCIVRNAGERVGRLARWEVV